MGCIHSKPCCSPAAAAAAAADSSPSPDSNTDPIPHTHPRHLLTGCPVGSAAVPSAGLSLLFSSLTQRGHYPDSPLRENQDALSIQTQLQSNPDLHLFAVFDGHGQFGGQCAAFARRSLLDALSGDPHLPLDPTKSFHSAFHTTNSLLHASDIDDSMSGTTAVAVLVAGDSLVVANCGDSRAVAGVWDPSRNAVVARDLSCDQTPFRKDEYERVRMCGARVLSVDQVEGIKDPEVQSWGDEESDDGDPPRLWVQDGMYPGTAFTRSLGDATAESIGVIAVPEVLTLKIMPDLLFFVVASDGVFEFLSSQAVVSMVANYKDPRDACAAIASESYRLWLEHENRTDDITIIIVHITDISDSGAATTEEVNQISTKACVAVSEKARAERYILHGSGTCHPRKDSFSELQSCPEFAVERSSACVVPSPEHNLLLQT